MIIEAKEVYDDARHFYLEKLERLRRELIQRYGPFSNKEKGVIKSRRKLNFLRYIAFGFLGAMLLSRKFKKNKKNSRCNH